jgi:glycosyltransferase involved in cell wall biosynthesis
MSMRRDAVMVQLLASQAMVTRDAASAGLARDGAAAVAERDRRRPDAASVPKRRYRVLFLSPVADLKGGAERNLIDILNMPDLDAVLAVPAYGALSAYAASRGIEVVTYDLGAVAKVHRPLRLHLMLLAVRDALRAARQIARLSRNQRCEFIHSNGMKTHVIAGLARALFGARVVQHVNDIPYSSIEKRVWRLLRFVADRVIVLSRPCWPGPLAGNVHIIPSALIVPPGEPPWPALRRPIRLGFVGRFHPQKGLDLLVDWLVAARDAGIDWHLVLRGRASPEEADYWRRIEARFRDAGIADRITVEGWKDWQSDWRDVYADIDVLLVPSILPEPLGRVIMEALGSGVPSIAYPAGGIPTLVKHGVTGYLADTPSSFVSALRSMLADPARFDAMRRRGFAFMVEEFGMPLHYQRIREIYGLVAP